MKCHFTSNTAAFNTVAALSLCVTGPHEYIVAPALSHTPVSVQAVRDGVGELTSSRHLPHVDGSAWRWMEEE